MKTLFAVLLLSAVAWCQNTTVTGTVIDTNGNAYANGNISGQTVVNTGQTTQTITPGPLNANGVFSIVVPSNKTYQFTICAMPVNIGPLGNATPTQICFSSVPIAIGTSTIDITTQLIPSVRVLGPSIVGNVPGTNGNILYNNNGVMGADTATTDGSGDFSNLSSLSVGNTTGCQPNTTGCLSMALSSSPATPTVGNFLWQTSTNSPFIQCAVGVASLQSCLNYLAPPASTNGSILWWNSASSAWNILAGNNSGSQFLSENASGAPGWASGTSSATSLSTLTAATAANTLANANNPVTFNWAQTTGSQTAFTFGETTAATGSSDVELAVKTLSGSTALPLLVTSNGNGFQMNTSGVVVPLGTGGISGTAVNTGTIPGAQVSSTTPVKGALLCFNNGSTPAVINDAAPTVTATILTSVGSVGSATKCSNSTASSITANSGTLATTSSAVSMQVQTIDNTTNSASVYTEIRGSNATNTGAGTSQEAGPMGVFGGNNSGTGATNQKSGSLTIAAGGGIGTATQSPQGLLLLCSSYLNGTTTTLYNVQAAQTTADQTQDATATTTNLIGINVEKGAQTSYVCFGGDMPMNASAPVTVGHTVCYTGSSAGLITDSNGTGKCSSGVTLGTVKNTAGVYRYMISIGSSPTDTTITVTATTTLPIIHMAYWE